MNSEQKKELVKTIEQAEDWVRIFTSEEGVFVVKAPEHNNSVVVFVELNPHIPGKSIKKRGIYLRDVEELEAFKELLSNPKVKDLVEVIGEYYSKKKVAQIEL